MDSEKEAPNHNLEAHFEVAEDGKLLKYRMRSGSKAIDRGLGMKPVEAEARFLRKARNAGVSVPEVYEAKPGEMVIAMQNLTERIVARDYLYGDGATAEKSKVWGLCQERSFSKCWEERLLNCTISVSYMET